VTQLTSCEVIDSITDEAITAVRPRIINSTVVFVFWLFLVHSL